MDEFNCSGLLKYSKIRIFRAYYLSMKLDKEFSAKLQKGDSKRAWTCVIWPESVEFFGPRGLVI